MLTPLMFLPKMDLDLLEPIDCDLESEELEMEPLLLLFLSGLVKLKFLLFRVRELDLTDLTLY